MINQPNTLDAALEAALSAARRGFYIVPGIARDTSPEPRKKPAVKHWQALATRDEVQIRAWWNGSFSGAPACIHHGAFDDPETGDTFHLVTIDTDQKDGKDGERELAAIEAHPLYGALPKTYTQRSPSGGRHRVFKTRRKLRQHNPWPHGIDVPEIVVPGIDTRAPGGQIYAAGGTFNGKPYTLEIDAPVALAPSWLEDLIGEKGERESRVVEWHPSVPQNDEDTQRRARSYLQACDAPVTGAGGDSRVVRIANHLGDMGLSADAVTDLMAEPAFYERCRVAEGPGAWRDYVERRVDGTFSDRDSPLGCEHPAAEFGPWVPANDNADSGASSEPRFTLRPYRSFGASPPIEWLVPGVLHAATPGKPITALCLGEQYAGKTTLIAGACVAIATGVEWLPGTGPTKQGAVVYAAGEDGPGVEMLLRAAAKRIGRELDDLPIFLTDEDPLFPKDAGAFVAAVNAVKAQHGPVALVVWDTISSTLEGGSENDDAVTRAYSRAMKTVSSATGATVVALHQTGKSNGHKGGHRARGHSNMAGDAYSIFEIVAPEKGDKRTIKFHKVKRVKQPKDIGATFTNVIVDMTATGEAGYIEFDGAGSATPVEAVNMTDKDSEVEAVIKAMLRDTKPGANGETHILQRDFVRAYQAHEKAHKRECASGAAREALKRWAHRHAERMCARWGDPKSKPALVFHPIAHERT